VVLVALVVLAVVPVAVYALTRDDSSSSREVGLASSEASSPSETSETSMGSEDSATEQRIERDLALYFGDSYFVSDFNYTNKSNTMARLSGRRLGYAKILVRGAGGTGFVQANHGYDIPPYLQQIKAGALDANDPDLVVVEGGSNDVAHPKWKIRRNAGLVLNQARSRHPGAMLVMVGPLDVDGNYSETTPVHRAVRKAARNKGVPYIDMRRWLEGHYDLVGPDHVHPTAEGHRLLGRKLAKALSELGA
jgi:acyl-CoA thioesterase I